MTATAAAIATPVATPDFAAIKQKQQATWASGDYAVVGTTPRPQPAPAATTPPTSMPASACSTSPPATATPPSRRRATSPR
jgi:hypothetical protein